MGSSSTVNRGAEYQNVLLGPEYDTARFKVFIAQPGIPASEGTDPGSYYLSPVEIVELLRRPDPFFEANPVFAPIRGSISRALKVLTRSGMIDSEGNRNPKGCSGCSYRTLLAVTLQFCGFFQQVVLQASKDPAKLATLSRDLRAYLVTARGVPAGTRVRLAARLKNNQIHEVLL